MTDVDCVELGTRHHQALLDIYNHYIRTSHVTFDLEAFSLEGRQPWFDQFDGARWQCVVAEYQGDAVGYACSTRFRPKAAYGTSVEASIYLHPDHTGRGLGPPLYEALFERLGQQDVHRVYAGVTLPNDASRALHERFGFQQVGHMREVGRKFDQYWDVVWLEKALS